MIHVFDRKFDSVVEPWMANLVFFIFFLGLESILIFGILHWSSGQLFGLDLRMSDIEIQNIFYKQIFSFFILTYWFSNYLFSFMHSDLATIYFDSCL